MLHPVRSFLHTRALAAVAASVLLPLQAAALSLAPEEFQASRALACVLAEQSLGQLSATEYGERTHSLLEDFDEAEQDAILAKAIGYYDGLMFAIEDDAREVNLRLEDFINSPNCSSDFQKVTLSL